MSVTQKDFKAIAQLIKNRANLPVYSQSVKYLAVELCEYFETQNAQFDRERFLKACGVQE
jgi:hypothetical protein